MQIPTVMESLGFTALDGVLILVHSDLQPVAGDWEAWLSMVREHGQQCKGVLVMTPGVGPDELQRKDLSEAMGGSLSNVKTAVVTASRVAAGIAIALRWLGADIKAFGPAHLDGALEYLEVEPTTRTQLLAATHEIRTRLAAGA